MDIEHVLNDALNKALCSKNRIQIPNSNNIAEFVTEYLKAIAKAKANMDKITDVDKHIYDIR